MFMKKLIVTADNAGFSSDVNKGIQEAYDKGIVTCVSLLPTGRAFKEAVEWVRLERAKGKKKAGFSCASLSVGIHLDLDKFFRSEKGHSPQAWHYQDPQIPVPDIIQEMESQIRHVISTGLPIRQLSSLHHLHLRPELFSLACEAAQKFHIRMVRLGSATTYKNVYKKEAAQHIEAMLTKKLGQNRLVFAPHFIDGWYHGNVDEKYTVAELACTPSAAGEAGNKDLESCCHYRTREYLRWENIDLITFDDLIRDFQAQEISDVL